MRGGQPTCQMTGEYENQRRCVKAMQLVFLRPRARELPSSPAAGRASRRNEQR